MHSMSECDKPSENIIKVITCDLHDVRMKRIIQDVMLNGASGKTEAQMRAENQARNKRRARLHTAQNIESDVHGAANQARIRKRYKNFDKRGNPDKIK
jgi:hypothetical protein